MVAAMKLITIVGVMRGGKLRKAGSPLECDAAEAEVLVAREFAREASAEEVAKHWPAAEAAETAAQAVEAKPAAKSKK